MDKQVISRKERALLGLNCRLVFAFAALGTATVCHSQQPWRQLQNLNAAQVAARWSDPPPEYGPEPYYGLNGNVSIQQVERAPDTLHSLGFHAATVQAGYNMPFQYLSPEYFNFIRQFILDAKKRTMCV